MADDADSNNPKNLSFPLAHSNAWPGTKFANAPHHLRTQFIDWIKNTGEPEKFWALCTEPLSKREPYIIIAKFQIDFLKRPNCDYIPCANCRPGSGKFLQGRLIYAVRIKKLFLIGNDCADRRTNRAANKEYDRRRKIDAATDELISALPLVPEKLEILKRMGPAANGAERLTTLLRKSARPLLAVLGPMQRTHGDVLVVISASNGSNKHGKGGFEPVASINGGREIVRGKLHFEKELREVRQVFEALVASSETEKVREKVQRLSSNKKLEALQLLNRGDKLATKLIGRISAVRQFFSERTFREIDKWGQHPLNAHVTFATFDADEFSIHDVKGSNFRVKAWPALSKFNASWPMLDKK